MLLSSKSPAAIAIAAIAAPAVAPTALQRHPHLPETHSPFTFFIMGCKPVHAAKKFPVLIPLFTALGFACLLTVSGAQKTTVIRKMNEVRDEELLTVR